MSFFILTTNYVPDDAPAIDLWTPEMDDSATKKVTTKATDDEHKVCAMGTPVILHTKMDKEPDSVGPIPNWLENFAYRIYLYPIERASNGRMQYGITTSYWGRTRWLFPVPTASIGSRFQFLSFTSGLPPTGNHPAKFEITYNQSTDSYRISNPFYGGKIMRTLAVNDFELYTDAVPASDFKIYWRTCNGPVIPCTNMLSIPKFIIISLKYKKALKQSLTAPYLSLVNINFDSVDQHFFFPPVQFPNYYQPNIPYTYNMHFLSSMDTMISFQDDRTLSTRTEAGVWEEINITGATDSNYLGGFLISNDYNEVRISGRSDGSVVLVPNYVNIVPEDDYFVFLPIGSYTPYPISQIQNATSSKI